MENKNIIGLISVLGIIFLLSKFIKKRIDFIAEFEEGIKRLQREFGLLRSEAEKLEQQYRLETAHFTSNQFKQTFSPGMEKFGSIYPYGWVTLSKHMWKDHPYTRPKGSIPFKENTTGKTKYYLKFPTLYAAMATTLENSRIHGGKFEAWFSKNIDSQRKYLARLNSIKPRIVNNVYK